jgi:hypothetical protein
METMIVYIDDATYARKILTPLLPSDHTRQQNQATRWVIVACAPKVTHDIGKWVSTEAVAQWREDWAKTVFDQITPLLHHVGDTVITQLASHKQSLADQTEALSLKYSYVKVLDARRPKFGQNLEPVTTTQPQDSNTATGYAAAVTLASVLAADF